MVEGEKAARREKMLREKRPVRSCILRPRRSAVEPKSSMKEPLARLGYALAFFCSGDIGAVQK